MNGDIFLSQNFRIKSKFYKEKNSRFFRYFSHHWQDKKYIHRSPIHMEVIDGKIWIQHDDTEDGVADDLLWAGVPREDIVLGFRHPEMRIHTGFATT